MKKIIKTIFIILISASQIKSQNFVSKKLEIYEDSVLQALGTKPFNGFLLEKTIKKCGVTKKIRARLLYLIQNLWSQNDIDNYLNKSRYSNYKHYIKADTLKLTGYNYDTLTYNQNIDSLKKISYLKALNALKISNEYKISNEAILYIGKLKIREAIPILLKAKKSELYDEPTIIKALAALNNKLALKEFINNLQFDKNAKDRNWINNYRLIIYDLFYVNKPLVYTYLASILDTSKRYTPYSQNKKNAFLPQVGHLVLDDLKENILNKDFQMILKDYKITTAWPNYDISNFIIDSKKWLLKNSKKVILKEFYFIASDY